MSKREIPTCSALADLLGVHPATVARWTARADWPFGPPAWRRSIVAKVAKWRETNVEDRGGRVADPTTEALKRERLEEQVRRLTAEASTAEAAVTRERLSLHDTAACVAERDRFNAILRDGAKDAPAQIVALAIAAGVPVEARAKLASEVQELFTAALALATGKAGDDDDQ